VIRYLRQACAVFLFCVAYLDGTSAVAAQLTHHDIEAKFDPETRLLNVTERISVTDRSEITFRLADWLTIESAMAGSEVLTPRRRSDVWQISLPARSANQLTLVLAGHVPALPPKDKRRGAQGALAGPEGSYLPGYAAWVADTGEDWVNFRLRVEVSGNQRAVATGRLIDEKQDGKTYRASFEADYPSELPSLFVGPYSVREQRFGKTRLRTYFHPDIAPLAGTYLSTAMQYIERYSNQIGTYPFDDFHIVSAPLPVGLGFPNLTYVGRMIVPLPFMRGQSLAHEILHNWWGNGVVADYSRGNWSEGLTTYMADYGLAATQGPAPAREMRLGWLRDYAALPAARDQPVIAFTSKTHQASQVIGYNKVAFIFHMLRSELGEKPFAQGLKLFWTNNKFQVAGWEQIRAAFEQAAGRDLRWFFRQWLSRPGAPRIHIEKHSLSKAGAVAVTLRQDDPTYRLSVNVDVETTEGRNRHRVRLETKRKTVELPVDGKLLRVSIDPGFDLFRRLLAGESPPILRDVTLAGKVTTFILSSDSTFRAAAKVLIGRLLREAQVISASKPTNQYAPVMGPTLVIGPMDRIAAFSASTQKGGVPEDVKAGTAAAWVIRTAEGHPVLFVRADSPQSVEDVAGPLPHYGRQSYLSFDGHQATRKGIWPTESSPMSIHFN